MTIDYLAAGVDPDRANRALRAMAARIRATQGPQVISEPGGFAGLYALEPGRAPVLAATTDGVGTKVKVAIALDRHDTIGIDLVAMNVNDLVVQGARPILFLDYIAAGRLVPARLEALLDGMTRGCEEAGCALLGGETAEMPGMYQGDDYDLAGFAVGVVERDRVLTGRAVEPGDALLGLRSSGVHANGFSLVRRVLDAAGVGLGDRPDALGGRSVGEVLLEPTRIYVRQALALLGDAEAGPAVRAIAHITGDGIPGNLPRVLPVGLGAEVDLASFARPAIFGLLQALGPIDEAEMRRVFNLGLGLLVCVRRDAVDAALRALAAVGEEAAVVGRIVEGPGVRFAGAPPGGGPGAAMRAPG